MAQIEEDLGQLDILAKLCLFAIDILTQIQILARLNIFDWIKISRINIFGQKSILTQILLLL